MSARALHLNLLDAAERRSSSPIRLKALAPVCAGVAVAFMALWAAAVFVQRQIVESDLAAVQRDLAARAPQMAKSDMLKNRRRDLQAECDQFDFYLHGRQRRGALLRRIAFALPEGASLTALSLQPTDAGATQAVENATLRLAGRALGETQVFELMDALKGAAFSNDVIIAENAADPALTSPRVLTFKQDEQVSENGDRAIVFDVVYRLSGRVFAP